MLQEFVENVERVCRDVMNELHTALPGIIKSVDLSTGMATVSPAGFFKKPTGETIEYPKISGVPIVMPQCVAAAIEFAFPVKAGDSCLIIISEMELDAWLCGEEADSELRYDLTNAICIPGLSSVAGSAFVEACKTDSAIIANGDVKLVLSPSGIAAYGDLKVYGNIISTATVKAGKIDLKKHVHTSAEPGSESSEPKEA